VRTGLSLLCGGVFCTAVFATVCLILRWWKKFSGCPVLGRVFVRPVAGRGIGKGWVVGLILWLLQF